jgi:hypothetical protein
MCLRLCLKRQGVSKAVSQETEIVQGSVSRDRECSRQSQEIESVQGSVSRDRVSKGVSQETECPKQCLKR